MGASVRASFIDGCMLRLENPVVESMSEGGKLFVVQHVLYALEEELESSGTLKDGLLRVIDIIRTRDCFGRHDYNHQSNKKRFINENFNE